MEDAPGHVQQPGQVQEFCDQVSIKKMPRHHKIVKTTNEPVYIPNESNGQHKTQNHVLLSENLVSGCAYPLSAW